MAMFLLLVKDKIAFVGVDLVAVRAGELLDMGVLGKVGLNVGGLSEDVVAVVDQAFVVQLERLRLFVPHLERLVPLRREVRQHSFGLIFRLALFSCEIGFVIVAFNLVC